MMSVRAGSASETDRSDGAAGELARETEPDIMADVAHALRNHFHRSYYWLDIVAAQALDEEGRTAVTGLLGALQSIERLSGGSITLTRPIELGCIRMNVDEVFQGIVHGLRRLGGTVTTGPAERRASVAVSVDPSQISRLVDIVGERLGLSEDRPIELRVCAELDEAGRLVVTIDGPETRDSSDGDVERLLDWALAQRVAGLHGGHLLWEAAGTEEHRAVLLLPASPEERRE